MRMSLGAFRTSPINNILFESGQMTIEDYRDFSIAKLSKSILVKDHFPLSKLLEKTIHLKYFEKYQSVLSKIVCFCKSHDIPFNVRQPVTNNRPNWIFNNSTIITSLNNLSKSTTNPILYQSEFREIKNTLNDHTFIFTDGSKSDLTITYSIIMSDKILKNSTLPKYTTIFSAEIIAIHNALLAIKTSKKKIAICTDSLSSLEAISNPHNNEYYPNQIRQIIIERQPNIKLIWVPGHSGIHGNELADRTAKAALTAPLITTPNLSSGDIQKYIKSVFKCKKEEYWYKTNTWYRGVNPQKYNTNNIFKLADHKTIRRKDQIVLTRLRLGHTNISHSHIFDKSQPKTCSFCGQSPLSLDHLFFHCNSINILKNTILNKNDFFQLITANISYTNISLLLKFLKTTNLYNAI